MDDLVQPVVEPEKPVEVSGQEEMAEEEGEEKEVAEEEETVSAEQEQREAEPEKLVEQEVLTLKKQLHFQAVKSSEDTPQLPNQLVRAPPSLI